MCAKKLEDLLGDFEKEFHLERKSLDVRIQDACEHVLREDFGLKCRISDVDRGVLRLLTVNASESFALVMKKTQIIEKVNKYLGESLLKDIRLENER